MPGAERPSVHNLRLRPHANVLVLERGINGVGSFRDLQRETSTAQVPIGGAGFPADEARSGTRRMCCSGSTA